MNEDFRHTPVTRAFRQIFGEPSCSSGETARGFAKTVDRSAAADAHNRPLIANDYYYVLLLLRIIETECARDRRGEEKKKPHATAGKSHTA